MKGSEKYYSIATCFTLRNPKFTYPQNPFFPKKYPLNILWNSCSEQYTLRNAIIVWSPSQRENYYHREFPNDTGRGGQTHHCVVLGHFAQALIITYIIQDLIGCSGQLLSEIISSMGKGLNPIDSVPQVSSTHRVWHM